MKNYCLIKHKNNKPDSNSYGKVAYNYFIQQNFISCEEYVEFLNTISPIAIKLKLYNKHIENIIEHNRGIFSLKNHIDPYSPIHYINIQNIKMYCNWLNTHNLQIIHKFPYDIEQNVFDKQSAKFWIPDFNEWYKSVYYDYKEDKYWLFPNSSDIYTDKDSYTNTMTPYGLINAGFKYFSIIDDINISQNKYMIAGGSNNRHPSHAKSGTNFLVSTEYYSDYISARLCKKSETKNFIIKLYDTYGDGWGGNYIVINDSQHRPLTEAYTLDNGYGPVNISLSIDTAEKNFNIAYSAKNKLTYENYYEVYNDANELIFKSTLYETPPSNTIVSI